MTGSATLDFGSWPGSTDIKSVAVTGQGAITGGSVVEAYVFPTATTNHSADEHIIDPPRVIAGNIVAGTGFTIYGEPQTPGSIYGQWTCNWVWI